LKSQISSFVTNPSAMSPGLSVQPRVYRREDGLTIVHQAVTTFPVIVTDVWIHAGAGFEQPQHSGIAHFLEHMVFKGTAQQAAGEFDAAIERWGGATNAATGHDYAHFYIATADRDFETTVPYLADLLLNAAIRDEDFVTEREVVYEEIFQYLDSPDDQLSMALMTALYPQHPYGRPVLGTQASLASFTPDMMRQFHHHYYQPENMTIVVVGNVNFEQALTVINQNFATFPDRVPYPEPMPSALEPIVGVQSQTLHLPNLELARLNLGWHGPGLENVRDGYVLDLIAAWLTGGRTAPLVHELREMRQWVQGIGSYFSLQRWSGIFSISAWLEAQYLDFVETAIFNRIRRLHEELIEPRSLERTQRQLCNDFIFSTETPSQLAGMYGYYQTLLQADLALTYPQAIASITPEEVQQVARRYLSTESYVSIRAIDPTNHH